MKKAVQYALEGIKSALTHPNVQRECVIAAFVLLTGGILKINPTEWAIIILTIGMVFAAELSNTALEAVVDLITLERHQSARIAKDVAAGMVLLTAGISAIIGLLIFGPKFLALVTNH